MLPAVCRIRSDDEALLSEVAADRLAGLGLQRVAPTVLACTLPLDAALARLRQVGYFPMPDQAAPAPGPPPRAARRTAASGPRRAEPPPAPSSVVDPRLLAERLLIAGDVDLPLPSGTAAALAHAAPYLTPDEIDRLAGAIEDGGRLRIQYRAASGAVTRRVIRDPDLDGGMLYAWCELREDERVFSVARILSVARDP